jgi:ribulose-5-phosphate 4-epimerase/fuculose-1-phosphate aldolase
MMAYYTSSLTPGINTITDTLLDKHFLRKHGANAYYGQK